MKALKDEVEAHGVKITGIESVNVHDAIKAGLPERDQYIENYIETFTRLGEAGIDMVCCNFMPMFDFTRIFILNPSPPGSSLQASVLTANAIGGGFKDIA